MTQQRHLAHPAWPDIAVLLDKTEGVVILPIGAIEQHGPHLPTITDTLLVSHVLYATLAELPADVKVRALPPLNYGKSNEHTGFPARSLSSASTLLAVAPRYCTECGRGRLSPVGADQRPRRHSALSRSPPDIRAAT
ncbi:MAG: creatininase family protein [Caldilineaceae bacterium]